MQIEVPELEQLISTVAALGQQVAALRSAVRPEKAWFTKREAAALKGVQAKTLDAHPYLWPNFGRGEMVGKTTHFKAEDVVDWLNKTDEQLEREYRAYKRSPFQRSLQEEGRESCQQ